MGAQRSDKLIGFELNTTKGTSVFGARTPEGYVWVFTNVRGEKTELQLSEPAMTAVILVHGALQAPDIASRPGMHEMASARPS